MHPFCLQGKQQKTFGYTTNLTNHSVPILFFFFYFAYSLGITWWVEANQLSCWQKTNKQRRHHQWRIEGMGMGGVPRGWRRILEPHVNPVMSLPVIHQKWHCAVSTIPNFMPILSPPTAPPVVGRGGTGWEVSYRIRWPGVPVFDHPKSLC